MIFLLQKNNTDTFESSRIIESATKYKSRTNKYTLWRINIQHAYVFPWWSSTRSIPVPFRRDVVLWQGDAAIQWPTKMRTSLRKWLRIYKRARGRGKRRARRELGIITYRMDECRSTTTKRYKCIMQCRPWHGRAQDRPLCLVVMALGNDPVSLSHCIVRNSRET